MNTYTIIKSKRTLLYSRQQICIRNTTEQYIIQPRKDIFERHTCHLLAAVIIFMTSVLWRRFAALYLPGMQVLSYLSDPNNYIPAGLSGEMLQNVFLQLLIDISLLMCQLVGR